MAFTKNKNLGPCAYLVDLDNMLDNMSDCIERVNPPPPPPPPHPHILADDVIRHFGYCNAIFQVEQNETSSGYKNSVDMKIFYIWE